MIWGPIFLSIATLMFAVGISYSFYLDALGKLRAAESRLHQSISDAGDFLLKATARTPAPKAKDDLHCSFCGKSQHEVKKLIAGPTVYICNKCVALCVDIINVELASDDDAANLYLRSYV